MILESVIGIVPILALSELSFLSDTGISNWNCADTCTIRIVLVLHFYVRIVIKLIHLFLICRCMHSIENGGQKEKLCVELFKNFNN